MKKYLIHYFFCAYLTVCFPLSALTDAEKMRQINEIQRQINDKQVQANKIQDIMNQRQRGKVANYLTPIELEQLRRQMTDLRASARLLEDKLNRLYSMPSTELPESLPPIETPQAKKSYTPVLKKDATVDVSMENEIMRDSKPGLRDERFDLILKESNGVGVNFTYYEIKVHQPDGKTVTKELPLNLRLVPLGETSVPGEAIIKVDPNLYPESRMQYTIQVKFRGVDDLGNPILIENEFLR